MRAVVWPTSPSIAESGGKPLEARRAGRSSPAGCASRGLKTFEFGSSLAGGELHRLCLLPTHFGMATMVSFRTGWD